MVYSLYLLPQPGLCFALGLSCVIVPLRALPADLPPTPQIRVLLGVAAALAVFAAAAAAAGPAQAEIFAGNASTGLVASGLGKQVAEAGGRGVVGKAAGEAAGDYAPLSAVYRSPGILFTDLPGFTRSVSRRDHALVAPESHSWQPQAGWQHSLVTHLVTPAFPMGAQFAMSLARMSPGGTFTGASTDAGLERLVLVIEGSVRLSCQEAEGHLLGPDQYAYSPAGHVFGLTAPAGALLLVFERRYRAPGAAEANGKAPAFFHSSILERETVVPAGEVYRLRRLLPLSPEHDFNIHVMDFAPGEYLHGKEAHYNQHGVLMLEGQGIMRFGDSWYPAHAGDAFWAAPFVPQWFGALGATRTRFIAFRDANRDPAMGGA